MTRIIEVLFENDTAYFRDDIEDVLGVELDDSLIDALEALLMKRDVDAIWPKSNWIYDDYNTWYTADRHMPKDIYLSCISEVFGFPAVEVDESAWF